ncbi:hypothetical protein [Lysobacter sp. 22409]|uniref:hypothetical protein n=1 Tax=Lysobacter sp. 22409 TaxID=3453917 RepID=UPI003F8539D9
MKRAWLGGRREEISAAPWVERSTLVVENSSLDDHFAAASRQNGWRRQADAQFFAAAAVMAEVAQEMF